MSMMERVRSCIALSLAVAALALVAPSALQADTVYVDDDALNDPAPGDPGGSDPNEAGSPEHPFDAIQEGIDAATNGDTVLVLDGTYTGAGNKDLDFGGKPITVRSENGPDNCIIDCEGSGRGFHFHSGEGSASTVEGFTITNGGPGGTERGGAILCSGSSPTIKACVVSGNTAYQGGGFGCADGGNPALLAAR